MPVKQRRSKTSAYRITEAAAAAFVAGDDTSLRRALGIKPWLWPTFPDGPTPGPDADWFPISQQLRADLEARTGATWCPKEDQSWQL